MEKFPKRRKSKDNPYTIEFNEDLNLYTVSFFDSQGNKQIIEINHELYTTFNEFELKDISFMNEYDRHTEHIEQTEQNLYSRSFIKEMSLEEKIIQKVEYETLHKNINLLPEI